MWGKTIRIRQASKYKNKDARQFTSIRFFNNGWTHNIKVLNKLQFTFSDEHATRNFKLSLLIWIIKLFCSLGFVVWIATVTPHWFIPIVEAVFSRKAKGPWSPLPLEGPCWICPGNTIPWGPRPWPPPPPTGVWGRPTDAGVCGRPDPGPPGVPGVNGPWAPTEDAPAAWLPKGFPIVIPPALAPAALRDRIKNFDLIRFLIKARKSFNDPYGVMVVRPYHSWSWLTGRRRGYSATD